jgi:zinc protease
MPVMSVMPVMPVMSVMSVMPVPVPVMPTPVMSAMPMPAKPMTPMMPATPGIPGLVDLRLANGARVIVQPLPGPPGGGGAAAVQLWIGAGTSAEGPDEHGCAHLLEHMLFKPVPLEHVPRGIPRGGPVDLASALEAIGGDSNAFTSHDETVIHATVPAHSAAIATTMIAAAALRPALAAATLAQEREVVVEEIKQYDDEPGQRVFQALLRRLHGRHSYGRPVLGLAREVRGHSPARLRAYHRRAYAGERVTLVVVGPVEVARVVAAARRALGTLPRARPLPDAESRPQPASRGPRLYLRRADVQEAYLMLAWPAPAAGDAEAPALDVAAVVLGHGEASRLVRETRRRDQVVSEISCSCESLRRGGSLVISAHTTAAQAEAAVAAIFAQVRRLRDQPIAAEELARARAILESDQVYRQETVQGRAHALGYHATAFGDLGRERAYFAALAQLSPEAVRLACVRALDPARAAVSAELPAARTTPAAVQRLARAIAAQAPPRPKARGRRPTIAVDRFGVAAVTLPNGLQVRACVERSVAMAAGWLVWPGGQHREPAALAGAAATTAALLTRGDARRDGDTISRAVDDRAALLDGFVTRSCVGLHWESLARDVPAVLELALECARSPRFPADELAEERRVALQELAAEADDPAQLAIRAMLAAFYGEHPFARPLRGTQAGLRALTSPRLRALWGQDHPLAGAVLGLVGDFDLEAALAQIGLFLETGRKSQVRTRRAVAVAAPPEHRRERVIYKDREQAHIALGFPGLRLGDRREPALDVLTAALGGQSGRLFVALRETQGLVYEISVSSMEATDAGHVMVHASTSQDKLARARAAIAAELERVVAGPLRPAELQRAQAWLIGQHEIGQQRRGRVASALAFHAAHGLDHARHFLYPARIAAVTAAEVWALARQVFDPARRVVGIVRAR